MIRINYFLYYSFKNTRFIINSYNKYDVSLYNFYTSKSAPLCNQKNHQTASRIFGKKVKTKSPDHIVKKTRKWRALNLSFLATSTANIKMIIAEIIKNICSKFIENQETRG